MTIKKEDIQKYLEEHWEGDSFLLADGFEDAFIGVVRGTGRIPVVIYDEAKCIEILMSRDGMTEEEAEDYFSFNVVGSWVGEKTPVFANLALSRSCT